MKNKKAIIVVDIQKGFLRETNTWIIPNIISLLENKSYDLYIEAVFSAPVHSIWDKQM